MLMLMASGLRAKKRERGKSQADPSQEIYFHWDDAMAIMRREGKHGPSGAYCYFSGILMYFCVFLIVT
jgi:hypothetical protein